MDSSWVLDGEGRDDLSHGLCKSQKRRWSLHPDKLSLQLAEAEHTSDGPVAIGALIVRRRVFRGWDRERGSLLQNRAAPVGATPGRDPRVDQAPARVQSRESRAGLAPTRTAPPL